MSNINRSSDFGDPKHIDEVYPVYEREPAPNWLLLAVAAAAIYWIITSYFGH